MITIEVDDKSYDDFPKLVSFPLGPPEDHCLSIHVEQKGTGKKRKRNVIGNLNGVQYVGHDYGDNNWKNNLNSYAVGMLDETTNIMTIVPADHIFVMRPNFPDKDIKSTVTSRIDNYAERRQSLTEEFGSKKKQRALKAAQSNTILAENISGADTVERLITKSAKKEKTSNTNGGNENTDPDGDDNNDDNDEENTFENISSSTEQAVDENRSKVLPPFNENATELEEAYPSDWMMSKTIRKSFSDYYDLVTNSISTSSSSSSSATADAVNLPISTKPLVSKFETLYSQSLSTCHPESQLLIKNIATSWESFFQNQSSTSFMLTLFHSHLQDTLVIHGEKLHKKAAQILKVKEKICQMIFLQFCMRLFLLLSGTDGTAYSHQNNRSRIVTKMQIEETLSLIPGFSVPALVVKHMMDSFTSFKKFQGMPCCVMDKLKRDKLLLYIIVLSLNVRDYVTDLSLMGMELKLQTEKLVALALQTGCTINKPRANQAKIAAAAGGGEPFNGSNSVTAHLVVPLKFPTKKAPIKAKKSMN